MLEFDFSYFADTFVYDMTTSAALAPVAAALPELTLLAPKWKQVMTHGFPTYRCQAQLACDQDSGGQDVLIRRLQQWPVRSCAHEARLAQFRGLVEVEDRRAGQTL